MTLMQVRDVQLFVSKTGQGSPLALMHGGPGLDHTTLLSLRDLAQQHTLVFYDHRCNGRSRGAQPESMTWENLTADADALRQALGFPKWALLGHSFGGNVALEYALRYPDRLSALVLVNTGGEQWWVEHNAPRLLAARGYRAGAVQAARRFFSGNFAPGEFYGLLFQFFFAYTYRFSPLKMARELFSTPRLEPHPEALIFGYSQLLKGWSVMERLGEIRVPTLVLAGRQDFLFPPEHQAILADRLPNARLEIIENAAHSPHDEHQAQVCEIIQRFLAESQTATNAVPTASEAYQPA